MEKSPTIPIPLYRRPNEAFWARSAVSWQKLHAELRLPHLKELAAKLTREGFRVLREISGGAR